VIGYTYPRLMDEFEEQEFDILVNKHGYDMACCLQKDLDDHGLYRITSQSPLNNWDY